MAKKVQKKTNKKVPAKAPEPRVKDFLDLIAPTAVKFNTDHYVCGGTYRCTLALRSYPASTEELALLRRLGEKSGVTVHIYNRRTSAAEEDKIIHNAENKNKLDRGSTSSMKQAVTAEAICHKGRGKENAMKIKANLLNKPVNFQMDNCQIEKVVELPRDQFSALVITPLTNQPFIAENKRWMFADDSAVHCLLVLGQGSGDGVLIYSAGYDYPRLAAYLPGMRDILNARLERAADFIVHQGTEATENGSWSISFKELEKQTEITVRRGNGLDGMLLDALTHRREVTSAALTDTGIDTAYHLNFCSRIPGQKPCYFTKLPEEQKTQLFYEAVETLLDFFGDENLYGVLHNGLQMPNEEILARGYLTTEAMLAAGAVMSLPENSGISLRDVLQYELTEDLSLVHAQGGEPVPLEQEEELTRTERKRFSDVLDAHVLESRAGEHGTELVIGGVKPERLERFRSILDAYKPEDQSMETIQ
ncbi:DUF6329 domain-containing protein [Flavonifractor plautii]|uniref:DUF6329 domain-containing protein n=2 Tax=Flavonifractor plautii TaxID=292800 RepID=UPI00189BAAAF